MDNEYTIPLIYSLKTNHILYTETALIFYFYYIIYVEKGKNSPLFFLNHHLMPLITPLGVQQSTHWSAHLKNHP